MQICCFMLKLVISKKYTASSEVVSSINWRIIVNPWQVVVLVILLLGALLAAIDAVGYARGRKGRRLSTSDRQWIAAKNIYWFATLVALSVSVYRASHTYAPELTIAVGGGVLFDLIPPS